MGQFLLVSLDFVDHEDDPPWMGLLHHHPLEDGFDEALLQTGVGLLVQDLAGQSDEEQC